MGWDWVGVGLGRGGAELGGGGKDLTELGWAGWGEWGIGGEGRAVVGLVGIK